MNRVLTIEFYTQTWDRVLNVFFHRVVNNLWENAINLKISIKTET